MIIIRRAVKHDIERLPVAEFLKETELSGGHPATGHNTLMFLDFARKAIGGPFIVAEDGDRIIGFTLGIASGDPVDSGFEDLIGFGTWVDPEWRHSGLARAMRVSFEEAAREDNFTRVIETVPVQNFYTQKTIEKYGYTAVHTVYERRL